MCSRIPRHLGGIAEDAVTPNNGIRRRGDSGIIAVVVFYPAEKVVAIDEVRRLRHLAGPHRSSPEKLSVGKSGNLSDPSAIASSIR